MSLIPIIVNTPVGTHYLNRVILIYSTYCILFVFFNPCHRAKELAEHL